MIELGDPSNLVIKLAHSYNLGIKYTKQVRIRLFKKGKLIKFISPEAEIEPTKSTVAISILALKINTFLRRK